MFAPALDGLADRIRGNIEQLRIRARLRRCLFCRHRIHVALPLRIDSISATHTF